jgi:hypothetical protein
MPPGYVRGHPSTQLITDRWVCVVARDTGLTRNSITPPALKHPTHVRSTYSINRHPRRQRLPFRSTSA